MVWCRPGGGSFVASLCLSVSLLGCAPVGDDPARPRPNVLLVVVDTLRADHLGVYGFPQATSPNLDALARRGLRFDGFRAAAPSTLASFTSMLTGRYPNSHGVYRNGVVWPADLEGFPAELGRHGYRTAAFVSSYCLTSGFGVTRDFGHVDEELTLAMDDLPQNRLIRRGEQTVDRVLDWLASTGDDPAPFFVMVHLFDPHWPYQPPAPYDTMFDPGYRGPVSGSMADFARVRARLSRERGQADADSRHLHALHLGEIRYTDEQIGRLLSGLDESDLADRTLVVVTADHGETFHEHDDYFDHGASVYDTGIHVPLIFAGPDVRRDPEPVPTVLSNVDLAPTLLDYLGLDVPEASEGRSFRRLLTETVDDESFADRPIFAEATKPHLRKPNGWPNRLNARCAVVGRHKLIRTPWRRRAELYDLWSDPDEQSPSGTTSPTALRIESLLDLWSQTRPATVPPPPESDPELLERLRSLGYVQ